MVKRAIHFGVDLHESDYRLPFFDSEKDATFYHTVTLKKGFESHVLTTEKEEICCQVIKDQIKQMADGMEPGSIGFVSLTAESVKRPYNLGIVSWKSDRKWLKLSKETYFGVKELNECLSYFDEGEKVFFLITEIQKGSTGATTNLLETFKPSKRVKADAVVLALSTNSTMKSDQKSSIASDVDLVLNASEEIDEIKPRFDALYGYDKRISSEVVCYNRRKSSRIFI